MIARIRPDRPGDLIPPERVRPGDRVTVGAEIVVCTLRGRIGSVKFFDWVSLGLAEDGLAAASGRVLAEAGHELLLLVYRPQGATA